MTRERRLNLSTTCITDETVACDVTVLGQSAGGIADTGDC